MNRRLVGLLAALCLTSACQEEPVGGMEPIPRPPGAATPQAPAPEPAPRPAAPEPAPDPSKVVLRWNLGAPTAFLLTTTSTPTSAPAPEPEPASARGKKKKAPAAAPAPATPSEQKLFFLLSKSESGEPTFHVIPQGAGEEDQGTMSERGFVLDGLSGQLRNLAVLVLELPKDPVGPGALWKLATNLADTTAVPGFSQQDSRQKNEVKLVTLTPGDQGEQVATIEYDLSQTVSGLLRGPGAAAGDEDEGEEHDHGHEEPPPAKGKKGATAKTRKAVAARVVGKPASAEVRVKGRGEFLVKAGHWRSWEATLATSTTGGLTLPGAAAGERTVRLTPVEPVPPELLQRLAKK
ncbi:hypothetical protein [Melittangium boletus]|uniref:Lipoprotein n=1 Tax=Melittangium boletus DSM 14713 TaxID=1294270 RepID=A0A250IL03_9BACT|nr:hypothetical protein [Melittangium boletus]ATB31626.1 hypothetical protein MEBOL_005089 [Melittangium boletus DSM 14713]